MTTCDPSCLVATSGEGIARVLKGDYAFFMESISIQYYVEGNCNLTQIGGPLDTKFFGIAFPKSKSLPQICLLLVPSL